MVTATAQGDDPLNDFQERNWSYAAGDFYAAGGSCLAGFPSLFVPKPGAPVPFSKTIAQVPYWSIVPPLTLLSAWLVIFRPGKVRQAPAIPAAPAPRLD